MLAKQTTLDLNGPILSFIQQPQSISVCDGGTYSGTTVQISTTHNNLPVRGFLYFPTTGVSGTQFDVVVLYHPTIQSPGVNPFTAAQTFLNITLNQINIKDKIIFSVAYPQDAIPAWEANPSLPGQQFPGIDYPNFYLGDNITYAEAALLWVKSGGLNTYFTNNNIPRSINKIFTFGHSQGAYLTHRLNTMHAVDGVISNAPGPIDLLTVCTFSESTGDSNFSCAKIKTGIGSTTTNPSAYDDVSLKNFLSGTLSPALFTQALDDTTGNAFGAPQVANMQNIVQAGLDTCTDCKDITFKYYQTGGHDAFVSNTFLQNDIRTFVGSTGAGSATLVGIATAFFSTQDPPNPATNTGSLAYRWHAAGFGSLNNGPFRGATLTGTGTTTLTISNAKSPDTNLTNFFLTVNYVPSAYAQPVGSAVTVGTGRSTGNALNEIFSSNIATLTVFPSLSVTTQPTSQTVSQTRSATFTTLGALTDTTQGSISYRWQLNGTDLSDSSTVSGSGTTSLSISLPNVSTNTIRARLAHPTACNSPIFTNTVNFGVVEPRGIINFEGYDGNGNIISPGFGSVDLFNGPFLNIADANSPTRILSIYASERDLSVRITLAGSAGVSRDGFLGGQGGVSVFELTMRRNFEYIIRLGSTTIPSGGQNGGGGGSFLYERARIIAVCGGGGGAGTTGSGGNGGGISVRGSNGFGKQSGLGANSISVGELPALGFYAGGKFEDGPYNGETTGGRISSCSSGILWEQIGISPCENFSGLVQAKSNKNESVPGTAFINRGFKPGRAHRNNGGNGSGNDGGGGAGAIGGNAATGNFGGGGGGGSGYHDGSIKLISTRSGGNTSTDGYIRIESLS